MAGELGLKNSFRRRVFEPLSRYRGNDAIGGCDISMIEFMQTRALNEAGHEIGLRNTAGRPITMEDLWCDLGLDPRTVNLMNILTLSDDIKYLAPEVVRDFILLGFETRASHLDLVTSMENVPGITVTTPWIKYKEEAPVETAEAEVIAEAAIEWGDKTVRLKKLAKGIHWTDELILSVRLPLLQPFLRKVGVALAAGSFTQAVQTLINGDQADASDACAVIGIGGESLAFADFVRAWTRANLIGMRWENLVTDEAQANVVLGLDEFKSPQGFGGPLVQLESKNRILPASMGHLVSSAMAADNSMLFDQAMAMVGLLMRGLLVESERIANRQISGTYVSIIAGYATIDRTARIIIDSGSDFASAGFPIWMAPII